MRRSNPYKRSFGDRLLANIKDSILDSFSRSAGSSEHSDSSSVSSSDDIVCRQEKIAPTPYRIALGVTNEGGLAVLPLYENHILVAGSTGSGKSYTTNRILAEILQIPMEQRLIAAIDLKNGQEIGKWQEKLDAFAFTMKYADLLISNIYYEMDRRGALIRNNPKKYRESKLKPSAAFPLIVLWIDELAVLFTPQDDKEDEAHRKHAVGMLNKLLFLGRSVGISVIVCIQRADSTMLGGYMKNNLTTRLCGKVGSVADVTTIFGQGAQEKFPAHTLKNFWFYGDVKGQPPFLFKTVGEKGDADLWRIIDDPAFNPPEGRGRWLYDQSQGKNIKGGGSSDSDVVEAAAGSSEHSVSSSVSSGSSSSEKTTKKKRGRPKKEAAPVDDFDPSAFDRSGIPF